MSDVSDAATVKDLERLSGRIDQSFTQVFEFLEQFSATTAGYFQKIERRLDTLETRMTSLEGRLRGVELRMDRLESRMDRLEERINGGFASVNERLQRLEAA